MRRRRMRMKRTAKSCGPDAAVLASSRPEVHALGDDGGKRAVLRGEYEVSRKAIAQGMPECSGCSCMLVCVLFAHNCTRDRGCSKHPAFPAPSFEGEGFSKPRADHAARTRSRITRHCERSEAIQSTCYAEKRTGSSARNDTSMGRRSARTVVPAQRRLASERTAMIEPNCNYALRQHLDAAERGHASLFQHHDLRRQLTQFGGVVADIDHRNAFVAQPHQIGQDLDPCGPRRAIPAARPAAAGAASTAARGRARRAGVRRRRAGRDGGRADGRYRAGR